MFADFRQDINALSAPMSAGFQLFREFVNSTEKRTISPKPTSRWFETHDYVKLTIVNNFLDLNLGHHIFPHQPSGTAASIPVLRALEKVFDVTSFADISSLLDNGITVVSNTIFCHTFMEKASWSLHDALSTNFLLRSSIAYPPKPLCPRTHASRLLVGKTLHDKLTRGVNTSSRLNNLQLCRTAVIRLNVKSSP